MIKFQNLSLALNSLGDALQPAPRNDRERDGAIQRFEYCIELSWKTGQKVLLEQGIEANTPKAVIRELGRAGYLDNVQLWLDFIDARNKTSHLYKEDVAQQVFAAAQSFYPLAVALVKRFESNK